MGQAPPPEGYFSAENAIYAITFVKTLALFNSYLSSPNILVPLSLANLLLWSPLPSQSYIYPAIRILSNAAFLGLVVKYSHDDTLPRLSSDLYACAKIGKRYIRDINQEKHFDPHVTFKKPTRVVVASYFASILSYIQSILKAFWNFICCKNPSE